MTSTCTFCTAQHEPSHKYTNMRDVLGTISQHSLKYLNECNLLGARWSGRWWLFSSDPHGERVRFYFVN